MLETISVHNMFSTGLSFDFLFISCNCNSMNNLSSYFGLVDTKIRATEKDLPVRQNLFFPHKSYIAVSKKGQVQIKKRFMMCCKLGISSCIGLHRR